MNVKVSALTRLGEILYHEYRFQSRNHSMGLWKLTLVISRLTVEPMKITLEPWRHSLQNIEVSLEAM
jgi:hypothetical protein